MPIFVFFAGGGETGQSEAPKIPKTQERAEDLDNRALKNALESNQLPELSDQRVAQAKDRVTNTLEGSLGKIDPRLKALQGKKLSSETAKSAPELVLGNPEFRSENPDLAREAFRNMAASNPSAALAFSSMLKGVDYSLIQQAIGNALRQGDPRTAAGYAFLLKPKDAQAVMAKVKKSDPVGYSRYNHTKT